MAELRIGCLVMAAGSGNLLEECAAIGCGQRQPLRAQ